MNKTPPQRLLADLLLLLACASLAGCAGGPPRSSIGNGIAVAHGVENWPKGYAVRADITVDFGTKRMIDGTLTATLDGSRVRLALKDGTVAVWDGADCWVSPVDTPLQKPRFHVLTWSYFLLAPFKLNDAGTLLEPGRVRVIDGRPCSTARLTFDPGTGDAPDDWYLVYMDSGTGRLKAMAYIVTYGRSKEEAEREPHAIVFDDYATARGVQFATRWTFYRWSEARGIEGEPEGRATISNVKFVNPETDVTMFARPGDSRLDVVPRVTATPGR
jgi:hypothetical protein